MIIEPQLKLLDDILKLKPEHQIFILQKIYENLMKQLKDKEIEDNELPTWLTDSLDNQLKLLENDELITTPWLDVKKELLKNLKERKLEKIDV